MKFDTSGLPKSVLSNEEVAPLRVTISLPCDIAEEAWTALRHDARWHAGSMAARKQLQAADAIHDALAAAGHFPTRAA